MYECKINSCVEKEAFGNLEAEAQKLRKHKELLKSEYKIERRLRKKYEAQLKNENVQKQDTLLRKSEGDC